MGAVLVGTGGPSRGRLVLLGTTEVSVGRDDTNSVAIDDAAASRRHFVIRRAGERFQLMDLDSRNGTFVNGVLVRERILEDNDEIRVGSSVFLFRKRENAEAAATARDGVLSDTATLLRSGDSIFLNPRKLEETLISARTAAGSGAGRPRHDPVVLGRSGFCFRMGTRRGRARGSADSSGGVEKGLGRPDRKS